MDDGVAVGVGVEVVGRAMLVEEYLSPWRCRPWRPSPVDCSSHNVADEGAGDGAYEGVLRGGDECHGGRPVDAPGLEVGQDVRACRRL